MRKEDTDNLRNWRQLVPDKAVVKTSVPNSKQVVPEKRPVKKPNI